MLFSSHTHTEDPLYHPVVIKDKQRFWKRILIVDDNVDITVTFKTVIEDNNNITLTKKLRYIHLTILSRHCQNLSKTARHILLHMVIRNVKILLNYQYYGSSCSSRNWNQVSNCKHIRRTANSYGQVFIDRRKKYLDCRVISSITKWNRRLTW